MVDLFLPILQESRDSQEFGLDKTEKMMFTHSGEAHSKDM